MLKRWGYQFKAAVFIVVFRLLALQSMFTLRRKTEQVIQLL